MYKLYKKDLLIGQYATLTEAGAAVFADRGKTLTAIDAQCPTEQRYMVFNMFYHAETAQAAIDLHCKLTAEALLNNQDSQYMVTT